MSVAPTLESRLEEALGSPADHGTVELIVRRPRPDEREVVEEGRLDLEAGLVGDCWLERGRSNGRAASPEAQVTVMNSRVVDLLAGGDRDRWPLAGDQLFVDLDLSVDNLPAGTRLAVGEAVLEVTPAPHTGCAKFTARFGSEAVRLVNGKPYRALRLRGLNARVVRPGRVRRGDAVRKL